MHHIYKTKGIILSDFDRGESNKVYHILTQDFGVLAVFAQGVRELKSKLNYSLQVGTLSNLDMVRGKEIWRITNVKFEKNFFVECDTERVGLIASIFTFIKRLTHGEEENKKLFNAILQFLESLNHLGLGDLYDQQDNLIELEIIIKLQILHVLGYGTLKKELAPFLSGEINTQRLLDFKQYRGLAIVEVNNAIAESHL